MLACLRYFLIGGAIAVGVCGIVQSVCAGYFIYQLYEYSPLTPSNVCGSSITLLVIGLITGMIGWCAWHFLDFTNRGQVIIFSVTVTVLTIANTSAGIWALVRHEQVDLLPVGHLKQVFHLAVTDDKSLWDSMHSKLRCCGVNGPADYRDHDAIPWSCCDTSSFVSSNETKGTCTAMYAYGCQHAVINRTRSILLHVFLLALATVLLQICFVMCMCCYVKACRERMKRRKDIMMAARSLSRTSNDFGTTEQPLNRQANSARPSVQL